jgi:hypothetical protein
MVFDARETTYTSKAADVFLEPVSASAIATVSKRCAFLPLAGTVCAPPLND